jgi:hypothetical protein
LAGFVSADRGPDPEEAAEGDGAVEAVALEAADAEPSDGGGEQPSSATSAKK